MEQITKYQSTAGTTTNDPARQLQFIFDEVLKLVYTAQKAVGEHDVELKYKALNRIVNVFDTLKMQKNNSEHDSNVEIMNDFYGATISQVNQLNSSANAPEDFDILLKSLTKIRSSLQDYMN